MALLHNPSQLAEVSLLARAVQIAQANLSPTKALNFLTSLLDLDMSYDRAAILELATKIGLKLAVIEERLSDAASSQVIESHQFFCERVLKLEPGQTAILSNGKVIKELYCSFLQFDWSVLSNL